MSAARGQGAVRLARLLAAVFFRSVELTGGERVPLRGPLVFVANHGNSLIDPLLLLARLPRGARFLAKHTLWSNLAVRPLLALADAIPVFRRQDGAEPASNDETFARCFDELAAGGAIALFPEGISYHAPALQPLKTGAARIALGAERSRGPLGLRIVPVGLCFEDKATFRSRALLVVGDPLDPASELAQAARDEREAVRALTERIEAGLRAVTLNFASFEHWQLNPRAADLYAEAAREMPGVAALGERFPLRRVFGEAYAAALEREPERVARIEALVRDYDARLEASRLRDDQVSARYPLPLAARYVGSRAAVLAAALPVAAVGTLLNYVPYRVPGLVGRLGRREGDLPATYKLLTGLLLAPLCWALEAGAAAALAGPRAAAAVLVLAPLSGWFALRFHERNESFFRELRAWLTLRLSPGRAAELRRRRAAIRDEIERLVSDATQPRPGGMPG